MEYMPDVLNLLFQEELGYVPRAGFMDSQKDINYKMRAILLDWLVEVHLKYNMRALTLSLTINLIDRYLAVVSVPRKRLQLVGVAALMIAAKYEEITPPQLHEYVYITDNAYKKKDLIQMECTMLQVMSFRVVVPTTANFLEYFTRANRCDSVHERVVWYLVELALLDIQLACYPPSLLAAAAVLFSNELFGQSPRWPAALVRHTRRSEAELQPCVIELRALLVAAPSSSLQAVQRKYQLPSNHAVSRELSENPNSIESFREALKGVEKKTSRDLPEYKALRNYEHYCGLPAGTATLDQVRNSSAGIEGWAASSIPNKDPASKRHSSSSRTDAFGLQAA
jgi:cyclin B